VKTTIYTTVPFLLFTSCLVVKIYESDHPKIPEAVTSLDAVVSSDMAVIAPFKEGFRILPQESFAVLSSSTNMNKTFLGNRTTSTMMWIFF
jgi:hypothetical protein